MGAERAARLGPLPSAAASGMLSAPIMSTGITKRGADLLHDPALNKSTAFTALIWWVIPIGAVLGAIIYGVWVTKYKNNSCGNQIKWH